MTQQGSMPALGVLARSRPQSPGRKTGLLKSKARTASYMLVTLHAQSSWKQLPVVFKRVDFSMGLFSVPCWEKGVSSYCFFSLSKFPSVLWSIHNDLEFVSFFLLFLLRRKPLPHPSPGNSYLSFKISSGIISMWGLFL